MSTGLDDIIVEQIAFLQEQVKPENKPASVQYSITLVGQAIASAAPKSCGSNRERKIHLIDNHRHHMKL